MTAAPSMPGRTAATLCLCVTVLFWGLQAPLIDVLTGRYDPSFVAWARMSAALPFLTLLLLWREPGGRIYPPDVPKGRVMLASAAGIGGFSTFFTLSLALGNPITTAIIAACNPIVGLALAWRMQGVRPTRSAVPATVLCIGGCVAAGLPSGAGTVPAFEGGEPLVLIAITFWGWYSVAVQRLAPQAGGLRLTVMSLWPAAGALVGIWLLLVGTGVADAVPPAPRPADWAMFATISFGGVGVGVLCWHRGVRGLGIATSTMFLNLIPIVVAGAAAALGTMPTWPQAIGAAAVVAGVVWAQRAAGDGRTA